MRVNFVRPRLSRPIPLAACLLFPLGIGLSRCPAAGAVPQAPRAGHDSASQAKDTPATLAPPGTWTVTLPGDVRVRLIGITAGPSSVGPWWGPDGAPLANSPYPEETAAERTLRPSDYTLFGGKPGERPFFFAYEITQPVAADVQPINANLLDPTADGKIEHTRVRCLSFLPTQKRRGTASLSLASAPWQTIARATAAGGHFAGVDRQNIPYDIQLQVHVVPIRVDGLPSGSVIRVEWSGHFGGSNPWQINVFDRKGQPMEQVVGGEARATNNYHIEFRPHGVDTPTLAQVKEIRVQVRPEQEVLFPDVAMQPTVKKDAK